METTADVPERLDFTGERYVPWLPGQIRYEHLHRYTSVVALCTGKHVLDVACGEGYGAALLARHAADVVGVDIDEETIAHATRTYAKPNLRFVQSSALSLPLPDASVDVVVSFETLEHFVEHDEFVAEVKRVLRPEGVFLVSSPNKLVYSDIPQFVNHYHVRELYYDELVKLANSNFRNVRIYGQQLAAVSSLRAMEAECEETVLIKAVTPLLEPVPFPDPTYFIAVCSNGDSTPSLSSIFIDDTDFLLNDMSWASSNSRSGNVHSGTLRSQLYQVQLDESASSRGFAQVTIAEDNFLEIRVAASDELCRLHDINTSATLWIHRSRIIFIVPID